MRAVETAGRIVAHRQTLGSGMTAPYGTINDAERVILFEEVNWAVTRSQADKEIATEETIWVMDVPKKNQIPTRAHVLIIHFGAR